MSTSVSPPAATPGALSATTAHAADPFAGEGNEATCYGLPASAFTTAWPVERIQAYLGIGRTQAYALTQDPSFPPRLRTGRSHRWNGLQVMAWLHHEDWRERTSAAATPSARTPQVGTGERRRTMGPVAPAHPTAAEPRPGSVRVVRSLDEPRPSPTATPAAGERRVIDPQAVHRSVRATRLADLTRDTGHHIEPHVEHHTEHGIDPARSGPRTRHINTGGPA